jgi:hypothetical protein
MSEWLACAQCSKSFPVTEVRYECNCGGLLSVERDAMPAGPSVFDERRSKRSGIDTSSGAASTPAASGDSVKVFSTSG